MKKLFTAFILGMCFSVQCYSNSTKEQIEVDREVYKRKCGRYEKSFSGYREQSCVRALAEKGNIVAIERMASYGNYWDDKEEKVEKSDWWDEQVYWIKKAMENNRGYRGYDYLKKLFKGYFYRAEEYLEAEKKEREEREKEIEKNRGSLLHSIFVGSPEKGEHIEQYDKKIKEYSESFQEATNQMLFWYGELKKVTDIISFPDRLDLIDFYLFKVKNLDVALIFLEDLAGYRVNLNAFDDGNVSVKFEKLVFRASELLARMYFEGYGVEKDLDKAMMWGQRAYSIVEGSYKELISSSPSVFESYMYKRTYPFNYGRDYDPKLREEFYQNSKHSWRKQFFGAEDDMILPIIYPILLFMRDTDDEVKRDNAINVLDDICNRRDFYEGIKQDNYERNEDAEMVCRLVLDIDYNRPINVKFTFDNPKRYGLSSY